MDSFSLLLDQATIRARVAFALAIAYRAIPTLDEMPEGKGLALKMIDECWEWQNGKQVSASQLYWDNMEDLANQCAIAPNEKLILGMNIIITAIYFSLEYMFEDDVKHGIIGEGELPSEFFELGSEMIDDLCNKALKASTTTLAWVHEMATKLARDFHIEESNPIGTPISKSYFGLDEST